MKKIKVLNLYCGVGGNRKLWPSDEIEVTAIELNPRIAEIYQGYFPQDKVIVTDAHQYLLDHFQEFDFIWTSPPCPSHSRARFANPEQNKPIYPSMMLYEEIIFLKHYVKCKWVVENVIAYYDPLIRPYEVASHWFWANFIIPQIKAESRGINNDASLEDMYKLKGFDLSGFNGIDKMKTIRNCVEPKTALHIFKMAFKGGQIDLFEAIPQMVQEDTTWNESNDVSHV